MTDPARDESDSLPSTDRVEQLVRLDEALRQETVPADAEPLPGTRTARLLRNLRTLFDPQAQDGPGPGLGLGLEQERGREAYLPQRIGRYPIVRLLGAGGFAVVYLAEDEVMHRPVAVKVPLPPALVRPDVRSRFLLEARAAARLDHPHIVAAYEAGEDGPIPFIVYAYCSGPTLAVWLRDHGPLPTDLAAVLVRRLADAIEYSHRRGLLHRDIKPGNVLLFPTTTAHEDGLPFWPRLTDFGLAKLIEGAASDTSRSVVVGTPLYMAPEQIDPAAGRIGPEADVFGLGCLLIETLTGQPPFEGATVLQVLDEIRGGSRERLRTLSRQIPRELAAICEKALAPVSADRYRTAGELRDDLGRYLNREPVAARPLARHIQFVRWLQSPARVAEAAGYVVLSNLALLLWILAWPLAILLQLPVVRGTTLGELMPYTTPLGILHIATMLLGREIGRRKEWAAAVTTAIGGLLSVFVLAVLLRWTSPPYPSIYPNERTRDIVFLLLFALFLAQFVLCGSAWGALRVSRLRREFALRERSPAPPGP